MGRYPNGRDGKRVVIIGDRKLIITVSCLLSRTPNLVRPSLLAI